MFGCIQSVCVISASKLGSLGRPASHPHKTIVNFRSETSHWAVGFGFTSPCGDVEHPVVVRAENFSILDHTLSQGRIFMGTGVIDSEESFFQMKYGDRVF